MTAALQQLDDLGLADKQNWTVDDLASLPEDLFYELIDGKLILSSPLTFHQWLGHRLVAAIEEHEPEGVYVVPDLSVAVNNRNEPRPDVVVVRDEGTDRIPVLVEHVLLAVEVVSADSVRRDRHQKSKIYAYAGIPLYWVVDPLGERITFTEHVLGRNDEYEQGPTLVGAVELAKPWPVRLDLDAWEARRAKR